MLEAEREMLARACTCYIDWLLCHYHDHHHHYHCQIHYYVKYAISVYQWSNSRELETAAAVGDGFMEYKVRQ